MPTELDNELTAILQGYDNRSGPFTLLDLSAAVNGLVSKIRESGGPIEKDLLAEKIAFEVIPEFDSKSVDWGTYYGPAMVFGGNAIPDLKSITSAQIEYWVRRSRAAKHPLLRARYADVAWDFSRKVAPASCPHDVPRIMIDAVVHAASAGLHEHAVYGIRNLQRALLVAIPLRDNDRVEQVRDAIIAFEDRVAVDHLPGLWGFSFDLLIEENRRVPLREDQEQKIIGDLESRLGRLADHSDVAKLDPHNVEGAALRLAHYYRRKNHPEDVRRVLGVYANSFLRKTTEAEHPAGSAWLEQVYDKLVSFNVPDMAKAILPHYREAALRMRGRMVSSVASNEIDRAKLEEHLTQLTSGDLDTVFEKLIDCHLLGRDIEMVRLRELMRGRGLLDLFESKLVDHEGRTTATIGTLEADPEGNLIRHYSQTMDVGAFFLRAAVERLIADRALAVEHVTGFVYRSPVMDPDKRPIVEASLRAYLARDWLVAIHLLVPQLEEATRRLVGLRGGPIMKKGRNDGLALRNLDELLRDERAEEVLGEDIAFYMRVLLTDQRGWNIRNDVAHGITPLAGFNSRTADRLFHALLILGSLRREEKVSESEGTAENPTPPA